jgi:hypothetical protein
VRAVRWDRAARLLSWLQDTSSCRRLAKLDRGRNCKSTEVRGHG